MKLIIQIPCYNEEQTLGITLKALPKSIPGIDIIETLIIDDGSSDKTVEVAKNHGVNHIIISPNNQGLARAFMTGLHESLKAGADIIVNTDADNQYRADDIHKLVQPIIDGKADIVIGARPIESIKHFSKIKKLFQAIGSFVVRLTSKTDVPDAPSGFRAITRVAAMKINVFSKYSYTLETIIQAGQKEMSVLSVPIRVNDELRPSRLMTSMPSYVWNSMITINRIFITYRPFRFFSILAVVMFLAGVSLGIRFLIYWIYGDSEGHVQSLILAAVLLIGSFQVGLTGLLADLISVNRQMLEDIQFRQKEKYFDPSRRKE
jgi:glycosyltransferase involved in cell wall biosynthesis